MHTKVVQFGTETTNGAITRVGWSVITQPKTEFKGGSVKWFDDNKLQKSNKAGSEVHKA